MEYSREEIREQQREAVVNAEQKLKEAEEVRDRYRNALRDDQEVYDSLSTKRENRQKIIEEHTRLNTLYNLTAGNVSGARMDLEGVTDDSDDRGYRTEGEHDTEDEQDDVLRLRKEGDDLITEYGFRITCTGCSRFHR